MALATAFQPLVDFCDQPRKGIKKPALFANLLITPHGKSYPLLVAYTGILNYTARSVVAGGSGVLYKFPAHFDGMLPLHQPATMAPQFGQIVNVGFVLSDEVSIKLMFDDGSAVEATGTRVNTAGGGLLWPTFYDDKDVEQNGYNYELMLDTVWTIDHRLIEVMVPARDRG